jgi:hypothetical protein
MTMRDETLRTLPLPDSGDHRDPHRPERALLEGGAP